MAGGEGGEEGRRVDKVTSDSQTTFVHNIITTKSDIQA